MRRGLASRLTLACVLILTTAGAWAREMRCDPLTGKIRVLYLGDGITVRSPFPYLRMEPSFMAIPVTACTSHATYDVINKQMRYYMPRTSDRLKDNFDVIILSDANREVFRPAELSWMSQAVTDSGLGIIMIGGLESYEGRGTVMPTWSTTTVAEVLPVQMQDGRYCDQSIRMVNIDREGEFGKSLPWDTLATKGVFTEGHITVLKQTSHLVAEGETLSYGRIPHLAWGDVGEGRGFSMTTDWTPSGGMIFMTWEYYPDFAINVVMFTAGRKLPDDLDVVYLIRRRARQYWDIRGTLDSMVDIVDSFGGDFAAVTAAAMDCDGARAGADKLYFSGEYTSALEAYDSAIRLVNEKVDEARVLARKALFNVYLIEWAAVTGTFLLSGFMLYTLMIRRKMYAEVRLTRLGRV